MRTYVIKRLALVIPTVFIATIIVFLMIRVLPGDLIDRMLLDDPGGEIVDRAVGSLTRETIEEKLRAMLESA